ncbi:MAG: right-handed parallel beta-helix repeat-containing protein, partial [Candidatus Micrarchaeales archaeon]
CYNQTGCGFVSCIGTNLPLNISQITLQSSVSSCGSIVRPGTYSLNSNLNMENYLNVNNNVTTSLAPPCINIRSNSVNLECNGHSITNAYVGISLQGFSNVTISNCNVYNSTTGIQMVSANDTRVLHSSLLNDKSGVILADSFADVISNVNASGGTFGIYFSSIGSSIIQNFTTNQNRYGLYLSNSVGNIFSHGVSIGNTRFDVFGTPDSTGVSSNLVSGLICNITDTLWAPCKLFIQNTSFQVFPISACTSITRPGFYNISQTIFSARPNCIQIKTSNVNLDCNYNPIQGSPNTTLSAIVVSGLNNITINKCDLINYQTGIMVNNSRNIVVNGTTISATQSYGIQLNNVTNASIRNNTITDVANSTILLNGVRNSLVFGNSGEGVALNSAISVFNSTQNQILNNTGYNNDYGIVFLGRSSNNTVSNNQYSSTSIYDYFCGPGNQGMVAEKGGINLGLNDSNCRWLANIPFVGSSIDCQVITTPGLVSLLSDAVYSSGATCFSVLTNLTTINCNEHTILAPNGGTFAYFQNSSQTSIIENCFLKGFTTAVTGINSSVQLINDTIYDNSSIKSQTRSEINLSRGLRFYMTLSNITTPYTAVRLYNFSGGTIRNDNITASTAFEIYKSVGIIVSGVTTRPKTGVGFYLSNSTLFQFQNNNLTAVTAGLLCTGWSKGSVNNTDLGGNMCSSQSGCSWIGSSSPSCH